MKTVDQIIEDVIRTEGGYVFDPADAGGETMYGITVAVARANGYLGPMRELPISLARKIYRDRYIVVPAFDQVATLDPAIGAELIDTGVNMGPAVAAMFLQRWLNAFNDTDARWSKLFVDGRVGKLSLDALAAFLRWRGADGRTVMLRALNGIQCNRYLELTESRPANKRFIFGWVLNRVEM